MTKINQKVSKKLLKVKLALAKDDDAAPMRNSTMASHYVEPEIVGIMLEPKASFINCKPVSLFNRVVFTAALKSSILVNFLVVCGNPFQNVAIL